MISSVLALLRYAATGEPERVDFAVHRGCIYASTRNRYGRLVRSAQDQCCERLASISTDGWVREYVTNGSRLTCADHSSAPVVPLKAYT